MGVIELQPEDLSIAFVELKLVLGFGPLSELSVGLGGQPRSRIGGGGIGSPNSRSDAIAEVVGMDVSVETAQGEDGDFKEGEKKSE